MTNTDAMRKALECREELLGLAEEFADRGRHKSHACLLTAFKALEELAAQPEQSVPVAQPAAHKAID